MKTIVKLSIMLALVTVVPVFTVNAQQGVGRGPQGGPGPGPGPRQGFGIDSCHIQLIVEDMADALSLTDEQKAAVLEAHYTHMQEMKLIPEQYRNDCVGEREARNASRKKMDDAVKDALSDDQLAKFDDFIDNRRVSRGHHRSDWK